MHPLKPLMKKLVFIYALSIAMVIIYFILRTFFHQDKALELKHFNTPTEVIEEFQNDKEEETESQQKFMLLPQKQK